MVSFILCEVNEDYVLKFREINRQKVNCLPNQCIKDYLHSVRSLVLALRQCNESNNPDLLASLFLSLIDLTYHRSHDVNASLVEMFDHLPYASRNTKELNEYLDSISWENDKLKADCKASKIYVEEYSI